MQTVQEYTAKNVSFLLCALATILPSFPTDSHSSQFLMHPSRYTGLSDETSFLCSRQGEQDFLSTWARQTHYRNLSGPTMLN